MRAACGGGGGYGGSSVSSSTPTLVGGFSGFAASLSPSPATTSQALTLGVDLTFTGNSTQAYTSAVNVAYVVTRGSASGASVATGHIALGYTAISGSNYVYTATAYAVLIPAQAAGSQTFCVALEPAQDWAYAGTVPAPVCATVTVN
jgi:hypothetical protein